MTKEECKKIQKELDRGLKNLIDTTNDENYPWAKKPEYEVKRQFWNPTPAQVNLDEM